MSDQKIQFTAIPNTEVELPSFAGSKVIIRSGVTVGEQRQLMKKYPKMTEDAEQATAAMIEGLVMCIKSRNFTYDVPAPTPEDANATKTVDMPITAEILNKFPQQDIKVMSDIISPRAKEAGDNPESKTSDQ